MLTILARTFGTATRSQGWDAPDHWRNPPPPRSSREALDRQRGWLRQQFGRMGL